MNNEEVGNASKEPLKEISKDNLQIIFSFLNYWIKLSDFEES